MANQKYEARRVFTPTSPARLTFIERESINDRLVDALVTPGKQVVVYGHSGSGKSTVLTNKLKQIYENHFVTRCTSNMEYSHLILSAFDQLEVFFTKQKSSTETRSIKANLGLKYFGIQSSLEAQALAVDGRLDNRIVPPQLTPQRLAEFIGESKLCWVLEDFHKIAVKDKPLISQMMKVFMDMADDYPELKIVAIGAVGSAKEVIDYDAEMRNRIAEIHVPLMTADEIGKIVSRGEFLLNFKLTSEDKNDIIRYSNGLAGVCHQLCLNVCFVSNLVETLDSQWEVPHEFFKGAIEKFLEDSSDSIKAIFARALRQIKKSKHDNCRLILRAMARSPQDEVTRSYLLEAIKNENPDYPSGNLTTYLNKLQKEDRGGILRYDSNSGTFAFSYPLYKSYAIATLARELERDNLGIEFSKLEATILRRLSSLALEQAKLSFSIL